MTESIHSEKTQVDYVQVEKHASKAETEPVSIPSSVYNSPERGSTTSLNTQELESYPDGGSAWLVVLGCFIFSAVTVGWGYVAIIILLTRSRND